MPYKSKSECCISIHSLRVEGDPAQTRSAGVYALFQSTPSVWRETVQLLL